MINGTIIDYKTFIVTSATGTLNNGNEISTLEGTSYTFDKSASTELTGLSSREISRLKAMGFIDDSGDKLAFTPKGKKLIVTMTLSEPNRL